ncbi:clathrin light chain protein [Striga asiatica]|uniref:Clathrin light chain protein n=1 Tax=Striga asiatica TaxID=4170 RepID=A0A5A7QZT2_STRAF|nr:clathrin light chain protein [Striga asiatica]
MGMLMMMVEEGKATNIFFVWEDKGVKLKICAIDPEYKVEFKRKRVRILATKLVFVASQEKFHVEADKDYSKSITDLILKEVPTIEKRKGKKEQDKKPLISMVRGPKPGKQTELTRIHLLHDCNRCLDNQLTQ